MQDQQPASNVDLEAPQLVLGQAPAERGDEQTVRRLGTRGSEEAENALGLVERIDSELKSVFSSIRSQSSDDVRVEDEKNKKYAAAGPLQRAFPERYLALLVTLAVEIPVSLIISGGSESLQGMVGVERYTLLMAFLPLTSAISGNVGLQASTLTTRAISHGDCSKATYLGWLRTEVCTAGVLALLTGLVVGLVSWAWTFKTLASGPDAGFAMTVGFAQAFSIFVAGFTGTCAPLIFSFIFGGDAGKWAGPMETAIQDVAGSFAMVYIAQGVLVQCIKIGVSPAITA